MKNEHMKNEFEYFVDYVLPLLVLTLGCIGNTFGLIVLSKKNMKKIGPLNMYKYMFIVDMVHLLITIRFSLKGFGIHLSSISSLWCKSLSYFAYSMASTSPMILAYLSIERFLSIKYPEIIFLKRKRVQFVYFTVLICFNLINGDNYLKMSINM